APMTLYGAPRQGHRTAGRGTVPAAGPSGIGKKTSKNRKRAGHAPSWPSRLRVAVVARQRVSPRAPSPGCAVAALAPACPLGHGAGILSRPAPKSSPTGEGRLAPRGGGFSTTAALGRDDLADRGTCASRRAGPDGSPRGPAAQQHGGAADPVRAQAGQRLARLLQRGGLHPRPPPH